VRQNTHGESAVGYFCNPALTHPHQPHVLRPPHPLPGGQRRQNTHGELLMVVLPHQSRAILPPRHPHPGNQSRQDNPIKSDVAVDSCFTSVRPHQPHILHSPHPHPGGQRQKNTLSCNPVLPSVASEPSPLALAAWRSPQASNISDKPDTNSL